jgi:hypothetical protein
MNKKEVSMTTTKILSYIPACAEKILAGEISGRYMLEARG